MNSYCSVFGTQDLVDLARRRVVHGGRGAAACHSVAEQIFEQQLQEIDVRYPVIQVGGTSLISGMVRAMEDTLGQKPHRAPKLPVYRGRRGGPAVVRIR